MKSVRTIWFCCLCAVTVAAGCEDEATAPMGVPRLDAAMDSGGADAKTGEDPNLVSALDDAEFTELCEGAQGRRDEAKPSVADRIQVACVAMVGATEMPGSVGECETKVAACVEKQGGIAPPGLEQVFDLMCEIRKEFDEDVTVEEVLDCWLKLDAKVRDLRSEITCEAVVADPSAGTFRGPPECALLVDGKIDG